MRTEDGTHARRIVIAGGGTGGHVFPAIAIAREILARGRGMEIVMVGTARGLEAKLVPAEGLPLVTIPVAGLKGKSLTATARGLAMLPRALLASWRILARPRPRAVVGVGGYASGPVVAAAVLKGIPTLIHEQNLVPGATNRWLAPFVKKIALTFEESRPRLGGRGVVTGNPVRREFAAVPARARGSAERRLLISGGSQGAVALNDAVAAALPHLGALKGRLRVVHQTGERDLPRMTEAYRAAGIEASVLPFIREMAEAMAGADLILSRAGSTTLAELTAAGRGALLVPLPTAIHDHQTMNARALEKVGAAVVLPQKDLTGPLLAATIERVLLDDDRLDAMGAAARKLGRPEAASRIADLVLELASPEAGRA